MKETKAGRMAAVCDINGQWPSSGYFLLTPSKDP